MFPNMASFGVTDSFLFLMLFMKRGFIVYIIINSLLSQCLSESQLSDFITAGALDLAIGETDWRRWSLSEF